jgi:excisionase family DNA binding protein
MKENEHETLMSVPEAAKYLGVSPITVWRKLGVKDAARELSCYRFGHRVLLSKEKHLLPYLHSHEQAAENR